MWLQGTLIHEPFKLKENAVSTSLYRENTLLPYRFVWKIQIGIEFNVLWFSFYTKDAKVSLVQIPSDPSVVRKAYSCRLP